MIMVFLYLYILEHATCFLCQIVNTLPPLKLFELNDIDFISRFIRSCGSQLQC